MVRISVKFRTSAVQGKRGIVYYQLSHHKSSGRLDSHIRIRPEEWRLLSAKIRGEQLFVSPVLLAVQREIDHEMSRIYDIADAFEQNGESYTAAMVIHRYLDTRNGLTLGQFADELMKRIMLENNKEKGEEFVNENYDKSLEELTWHLIKEKLVEANGIKVEQGDITDMAKETTRAQFAQYGMINVPDELLENYSKEMLKKRESVEALVNRVIESKLGDALKAQVTLNHKAVSAEEFNQMFQ